MQSSTPTGALYPLITFYIIIEAHTTLCFIVVINFSFSKVHLFNLLLLLAKLHFPRCDVDYGTALCDSVFVVMICFSTFSLFLSQLCKPSLLAYVPFLQPFSAWFLIQFSSFLLVLSLSFASLLLLSGNKAQITILACANVVGTMIPPMVIF